MTPAEEDAHDWEARYHAVLRWNTFWRDAFIVAVIVSLTMVAVWAFLLYIKYDYLKRIYSRVEANGDVRANTIGGPAVITHLWARSREGSRIAARLPQPITLIDSESAQISRADIEKLDWQVEGGWQSAPPPKNSDIQILFYRPELSESRKPN